MEKETKNVRQYAGWYKSYMKEEQGIALIECLEARVAYLENLLYKIQEEVDDSEAEYSDTVNEIDDILYRRNETVSAEKGPYRWEM